MTTTTTIPNTVPPITEGQQQPECVHIGLEVIHQANEYSFKCINCQQTILKTKNIDRALFLILSHTIITTIKTNKESFPGGLDKRGNITC